MGNLFERLGQPPPTKPHSKEARQIERLLDWLINHWTKDTITARGIYNYGPYPLRNEKTATLNLAQILVERGWLVPVRPRQYRSREWKIGRPTPRS